MKTKLLKKLRKDCSWTCVKQEHMGGVVMYTWVLLQQGFISKYSNSELLIRHMLTHNANYHDSVLDWRWDNILHRYHVKVNERKFRKYKQR
jgi:hypothetical protein